ncbi:MAG: hypothetical protein J5685_09495 [Clostridiales bacterium]|nr:hypothetical protein [Clostridiales bacterium]
MYLSITDILSGNSVALLALGIIFCLLFLLIGYFIGIKLSPKKETESGKKETYEGKIQTLIIDYLNLGVIAYDANGAVYSNGTLFDLKDFLGDQKKVPRDINAFLSAYGENNHLKSDYLLNIENEDSVIRANYVTGRTIYEIKILHETIGDEKLDIVIIDDITQIKDDERRQKDLAANVSHELKTPLTVIRASEAFVNSITPDKMPDYDQIKKWGNRIIANSVRMQDIVQDFLILSMASQSVRMNIIDLEETIARAIANLNDYPGRDKVDIRCENCDGHHLIFGNSNLIMRVIINLLTNAVKYISYDGKTDPDTITVSVVSIEERVGVQVSDNGRGIPQKDIAHLFERFYRVDNSGSRAVGGSGIGLAIAKDVSDMHDGDISVTASTEKSGSTFTFMLPKAKTVFDSVFDDANTGIVSEKQYYRGAADFIGVQAAEFIRSAGYDEVEEKAALYEKTPAGEKTAHDRNLADFLTALGKERFDELTEELLYVEDEGDDFFDGENDEGFDDEVEEAEDNEASSDPRSVRKAPEISRALMKELEEEKEPEPVSAIGALDKEEARKILTAQILPRSTGTEDKGNAKADANESIKMYNGSESAVRKVLDETAPLPVQSKPNEEE